MSWLFFALLANFLFSVANIIDQILKKRHITDAGSLMLLWVIFYLFLFVPATFFMDISIPPIPVLAAAMAAGGLAVCMIRIYVYAISHEEISKVMPILQFSAVFALVFSIVFLGEILSRVQYMGFAIVFFSGLLLAVERIESRLRFSRPVLLMLVAAAILAVINILMKFVYITESYWNGYFWFIIGNVFFLAPLTLVPGVASRLKISIRRMNLKVFLMLALTITVTFLADLSIFFAISQGPISLITVVGASQTAMLFIMALFLSRFFPGILKEKTDRKTLLTKALAIALMIAGVALMNGGAR